MVDCVAVQHGWVGFTWEVLGRIESCIRVWFSTSMDGISYKRQQKRSKDAVWTRQARSVSSGGYLRGIKHPYTRVPRAPGLVKGGRSGRTWYPFGSESIYFSNEGRGPSWQAKTHVLAFLEECHGQVYRAIGQARLKHCPEGGTTMSIVDYSIFDGSSRLLAHLLE